ncbi:Ig-like domain-containing protein [Rheinheimera marina]|uniref:Ig-like domain-containing protein n=1 Tax=Rheinheimera marina TaxID=1774958 RepID=A0ABV9JR18_9GAMM
MMTICRYGLLGLLLLIHGCGGGGGTIENPNPGQQEVISINLSLSSASGQSSSELSVVQPLTLQAQLTSSTGRSMTGQLLTFSLSDAELARFNNDAGTAQTNGNGIASIGLVAGSKSGAGVVTARLSDTVSAQISFNSAGDADDEQPSSPVGSVRLVAQNLQLGSGASEKVDLSALVLDANNVLQSGVSVQFSASSGELEIVSSLTEADGVAKAKLSSTSDKSLRTIDVTAAVGNKTSTVKVDVVGTGILLSAPRSVVLGDAVTMTADLTDSAGTGIQGELLTVSSSLGNPVSAASFVTAGNSGRISFSYRAQTGGQDELRVVGLGAVAVQAIAIQTDSFSFVPITPAVLEVPLGTEQTLTLSWLINGMANAGKAVNFSTTRGRLGLISGALNSVSVDSQTNDTGQAQVLVGSDFAGIANIAATEIRTGATDLLSTRASVEFVATVPAQVEVQANPAQVGSGEQSVIRAVVRDINNNPVKNRTVAFNLNGAPGGQLDPATAVTDSQGLASTVFTADSLTGAATTHNLNVSAVVLDTAPAVSSDVALAVGGRTLFFRFGTGNSIEIPSQSAFSQQFSVFVTDSSGNPVVGQTLSVAVLPLSYDKGYWVESPDASNFKLWVPVATIAGCASEDVNFNGILDAGEDWNGDGQLTPGNVASVPRTVQADSNGVATFNLSYPADHAPWTVVELKVSGSAAGTENISSRSFQLNVPGVYVSEQTAAPASNPFGRSSSCADTL